MPTRTGSHVGSPNSKSGFKWKKIQFWKGGSKKHISEEAAGEASVGLASATTGSRSGSASTGNYSSSGMSSDGSSFVQSKMGEILRHNSILERSVSGAHASSERSRSRSGLTMSTEETLSPSVTLLHQVFDEESTVEDIDFFLGLETSGSASTDSQDGTLASFTETETNVSQDFTNEEAAQQQRRDTQRVLRDESTYGNGTTGYDEDDEVSGDGSDEFESKEFDMNKVIDTIGHMGAYLNCGRMFTHQTIHGTSVRENETYTADSRTGTEGSFTLDTFDERTLSTLGKPDFASVEDFYEYMQSGLAKEFLLHHEDLSFDNKNASGDKLFPTDESSLESGMDQSHIYLMMTNARRERNNARKQSNRVMSLLDAADFGEEPTKRQIADQAVPEKSVENKPDAKNNTPEPDSTSFEIRQEKWLRTVKEAVSDIDGSSSRSPSIVQRQREAAQESLLKLLQAETAKKLASSRGM